MKEWTNEQNWILSWTVLDILMSLATTYKMINSQISIYAETSSLNSRPRASSVPVGHLSELLPKRLQLSVSKAPPLPPYLLFVLHCLSWKMEMCIIQFSTQFIRWFCLKFLSSQIPPISYYITSTRTNPPYFLLLLLQLGPLSSVPLDCCSQF